MITIMTYPKCSTCRNAVKWLEANEIKHTARHILDEKLSAKEIKAIHEASELPIKRFFNTSGMKYRELGLKDKIDHLSLDECYKLLASDGMLVKRPLVFDGKQVTLGFKVPDFEATWLS